MREEVNAMTKTEFAARLKHGCASVMAAEGELTEIDSHFGDADHGLTMTKIVKAIDQAVEQADGGIQSMLDDAAMAVMTLNGGSAVPLWNTWLDGLQEVAPEGDEIDVDGLKAIFARALEELSDMSGAKVGDKTMMDALIPASQAIAAYEGGDENGLFAEAARAAAEGAEASKQFVSKFGRAKSYGEKTIGTPDAGAMSMSYFFQGLAQA
ncbi:MAG: DAK2 domain-containing protein [Lawsonibacter sp.]|nr:DAK2 domain-containing protein [Lawsonibacter sp.]